MLGLYGATKRLYRLNESHFELDNWWFDYFYRPDDFTAREVSVWSIAQNCIEKWIKLWFYFTIRPVILNEDWWNAEGSRDIFHTRSHSYRAKQFREFNGIGETVPGFWQGSASLSFRRSDVLASNRKHPLHPDEPRSWETSASREKDPATSLKHYSCSPRKAEFISRRKWSIVWLRLRRNIIPDRTPLFARVWPIVKSNVKETRVAAAFTNRAQRQ